MSHNEVGSVLGDMGISMGNLPSILVDDPQAKKLEAKAGDVIEIEREEQGKPVTYYRRVVEK
ncbi:MAG: DNA-directed RNA polymerase subunit H [Candidatus Micrarchaeota archaeon]|nr:DNA-directed RNA polymerase subunit H [Candidatus Micrarchaeota archaeon]